MPISLVDLLKGIRHAFLVLNSEWDKGNHSKVIDELAKGFCQLLVLLAKLGLAQTNHQKRQIAGLGVLLNLML